MRSVIRYSLNSGAVRGFKNNLIVFGLAAIMVATVGGGSLPMVWSKKALALTPTGSTTPAPDPSTLPVYDTTSHEGFQTLNEAMADADTQNADTIKLNDNLAVTNQQTITKSVTIDGNGKTLSAGFTKTDNNNNSAIGIQADNVTIKNITVDGAGSTNLHGINVYESTGVNINDTTIKNFNTGYKYGLVVNSSEVTVNNLTTSNNSAGVNVDQNTSAPAVLTINGVSHHNDDAGAVPGFAGFGIYVDDSNKDVSVVDTNHQYHTVSTATYGVSYLLNPVATAPAKPTNFYFNKSQNDTTNRTLVDGSTTNTTPLVGTGSIAGEKFLWTHWDSQPNVTYHIETAFQKSDGTWKKLHTSNNSKPQPYRFYGFGSEGNGRYRMQVTAHSTINSLKSSTATVYLSYDTKSPAASFSPNFADNSYVNGNFHVSGIANDNVKLKSVFFDVRDSSGWVAGCVASPSLVYANDQKDVTLNCDINTSSLVEGHQYTLRIHANDYAGYGGGQSRTFTIDRTAPVISVKDGFVGNKTTKTFSNVSFKLFDAVLADKYTINGGPASDFTDNKWSDANFDNIKSRLIEGPNTITLYDKAGNSTDYTFTYDTTAPTLGDIKVIAEGGSELGTSPRYNPWKVTTTGNGDANGVAGVYAYVYRQDGTNWTRLDPVEYAGTPNEHIHYFMQGQTNLDYWVSSKNVGNFQDGHSYRLVVWAKDKAGNESIHTDAQTVADSAVDSAYFSPVFTIDHTAPTVEIDGYTATANSITPQVTATDTHAPLTYAWVANDPGSISQVVISDAAALEPNFTVSAGGTYSFTLTAMDPAGNSTSQVFEFTYVTPPAEQTPPDSNQFASRAGIATGSSIGTPPTQPGQTAGGTFANVTAGAPGTTPQVLGARSTTPNDSMGDIGNVLGKRLTMPEAASTGSCSKLLGLCWYYWVPIVAVIVGIVYYGYRRTAEEPYGTL